jgi:hypothetical protein
MPGDYATHPLGAPGSPKAVANGCKCPVIDNARGAGIGGGNYWINGQCQIHNNALDTMPINLDPKP